MWYNSVKLHIIKRLDQMNILQKLEKNYINKLSENTNTPDFKPGDTVRVNIKITDGTTQRVQAYEGVCIARSNKGVGSNFTVRKISNGYGVERQLQLYSPSIDSIVVVKRGIVRRAKLYYMRQLKGKAARIKERFDFGLNKKASKPKVANSTKKA